MIPRTYKERRNDKGIKKSLINAIYFLWEKLKFPTLHCAQERE